ncbi:hypothetical protein GCM10009639_38410 [Kitasatospora putterlickiae]|uniref:D-alanyl-D-alanine carboxypeptidase n=1 Tax=Kitasatospora putterlickiae TaxID=221725 RepID=A0ABP4IU03_9ACTN
MSLTLTDQDKTTLRTAAYGAVALLAAADATGSPHRIATHGSVALASGTGPVGHALAGNTKVPGLDGRTVADHVLPALTAAATLLHAQDPAEAENFRAVVNVALATAAQARKGEPTPAMAEITRKINDALTAAA